MKRTIAINVTIDTETALVTNLDVVEGASSRTEFVDDGVDDPITINRTTALISEMLIDLVG